MRSEEGARHGLYTRLVHVLGEEQAATLMEYLPPVPWRELATKSDLQALGDRLDQKIELTLAATEGRLRAEFHTALAAHTRTFVLAMAGMVAANGAVVFTAVRFGAGG